MAKFDKSVLFKRIRLYGVGLAMGLFVSFYIFGDRYPTWLPGSRVMEDLNRFDLNYTSASDCFLDCNEISKEDIQVLLGNGEVNFDKSKTKGEDHPSYAIDGQAADGRSLRVFFYRLDSTYEVTGGFVLEQARDCACD